MLSQPKLWFKKVEQCRDRDSFLIFCLLKNGLWKNINAHKQGDNVTNLGECTRKMFK